MSDDKQEGAPPAPETPAPAPTPDPMPTPAPAAADPTPAERPADAPADGWAPPRSRGRIILFGAIILVGALAILYAWGLPPFRANSQTTDNAYVRGQTTIIAPQVGGYVTAVLVQDFQTVAAG